MTIRRGGRKRTIQDPTTIAFRLEQRDFRRLQKLGLRWHMPVGAVARIAIEHYLDMVDTEEAIRRQQA